MSKSQSKVNGKTVYFDVNVGSGTVAVSGPNRASDVAEFRPCKNWWHCHNEILRLEAQKQAACDHPECSDELWGVALEAELLFRVSELEVFCEEEPVEQVSKPEKPLGRPEWRNSRAPVRHNRVVAGRH